MQVATSDLKVFQGTTHEWELYIYEDSEQTQLSDLSGYSARGQIREEYTSSEVSATFNCTIPSNLDNPSGPGLLIFSLSSDETAMLRNRQHVYDIELYITSPSGIETVFRILQGSIFVDPEVTR